MRNLQSLDWSSSLSISPGSHKTRANLGFQAKVKTPQSFVIIIDTSCFSVFDMSFSLIGLIASIFIQIISISLVNSKY